MVGICVLWKITDKSGHTSTAKIMMDEFLSTVKNSVILPGGTLDVSPIGWLSSLPPMMPGQRINAAVKEGASRVADAARITASVDSLIFEDGETWGRNSCHLDQEIAARKVAAAHVAELVEGAVASQNDVREVLHQLARAPFNPATDFQAKWEARFADQMLSRGGDIGPQLRYLQKLPTPPEMIQRRY